MSTSEIETHIANINLASDERFVVQPKLSFAPEVKRIFSNIEDCSSVEEHGGQNLMTHLRVKTWITHLQLSTGFIGVPFHPEINHQWCAYNGMPSV
jgi:hypothetical protein